MPWEPKAAFAAVAEYYEQVSTDPPSSEPLPRRGHRVAKLLANPRLSSSGNSNAGYVPWRYIAQHPYVTYQADLPGYAKRSFEVEQMLLVSGIQDVTNGYSSSSAYSSAATTATPTFNDGVNDILYSRRPLSDYDQLLNERLAEGGRRQDAPRVHGSDGHLARANSLSTKALPSCRCAGNRKSVKKRQSVVPTLGDDALAG